MLTADLAHALRSVRRPGDFCTSGTAALLPPLLEVDAVGRIALPLLASQAEQLIAVASAAPFGRGEATLVDPAVRRSWQISPDRVRLGGRHWEQTLQSIVERATAGLGVDFPVIAELYKLLVYDVGSFFVGHRDTEKTPGMFATLLVVLPSVFSGGDLLVRHKGREARIDLQSEDPAETKFAAFYADCVHEVLPVASGHRLTLVYTLRRTDRGRRPEPPDHGEHVAAVATRLREWSADLPENDVDDEGAEATPQKVVYLLEHAYTPAELGFAALKGADAAVAQVLAAAAGEAACEAHLALLTIEESGPAEYSQSYNPRRGRGRAGEDEDEEFEIVEIGDSSLMLSDWRSAEGNAAMPFDLPTSEHEIAPPDARDALQPDEVHFHEATGNEGASFERTYRRAAVVLWPSERKLAVLCDAGLSVTLPYLEALAAHWAASGAQAESRQGAEASSAEASSLAAAMIDRWPARSAYDWDSSDGPVGGGQVGRMLAALGRLGEAAEIERLLTDVVAEGALRAGDTGAIVAALAHLAPPQAEATVVAVIEGQAATALAACAGLLARLAGAWPPNRLRGLAAAAVALCAALPGDPASFVPDAPWRRRPSVSARCIEDLLAGLLVADSDQAMRAAEHMLAWPATYGVDAVLIPALRRLVGMAGAAGTGAVQLLCRAAGAHLRARIAEPLAPPPDWRRDNDVACRCRNCAQLGAFLLDPAQEVWLFRAAAAERGHVESSIRNAGSDVATRTKKRGSPHTLVCTKTQASYERHAAQRQQDLADLALIGG